VLDTANLLSDMKGAGWAVLYYIQAEGGVKKMWDNLGSQNRQLSKSAVSGVEISRIPIMPSDIVSSGLNGNELRFLIGFGTGSQNFSESDARIRSLESSEIPGILFWE